jgi:hypothetical protein
MTASTADVVELINAQHQQVKGLLTRVSAASGTDLESAFCDLRRTIVVHETAEEEVVYPALRATSAEGQRVADERTKEEQEGIRPGREGGANARPSAHRHECRLEHRDRACGGHHGPRA